MTVSQIMEESSLGSPSSLYKRLGKLRDLGFLKNISVEDDCRTKYYVPTQKSIKYFELLGQAIESIPESNDSFIASDYPILSPNQRTLLESITAQWRNNALMSVTEIMKQHAVGSPSTVHKLMVTLRELGFLKDLYINGNRKIKYQIPTKKTLQYFETLGIASTST